MIIGTGTDMGTGRSRLSIHNCAVPVPRLQGNVSDYAFVEFQLLCEAWGVLGVLAVYARVDLVEGPWMQSQFTDGNFSCAS